MQVGKEDAKIVENGLTKTVLASKRANFFWSSVDEGSI